MRRKFTVFLTGMLALALTLCVTVKAADIDDISPYIGQYLLIYNPDAATGLRSTGALSSDENPTVMHDEDIPTDVVISGIDTINGQPCYQVEPDFKGIDPSSIEEKENSLQMNALQTDAYSVGDTVQFTAQYALVRQMATYTVSAQLMAAGEACDVFIEEAYAGDSDSLKISHAQAATIAAEFDRVQALMQNDFGPYLKNNDNKIVILLHDIKEYQVGGSGNIYVGGYFDPNDDLKDSSQGGNGLVMIHIDIPQLLRNASNTAYEVTGGYSTIVHEFQHLINWTDTMKSYDETGRYQENDLWMNEMMSMAAQHMIYAPLSDRIASFNSSSKVQNGAVLTYTDYSTNGTSNLGANYGLPYLFGQYLRVQTDGLSGANGEVGGDGIYKLILQSNDTNYSAISQALNKLSYSVSSFDTLEANFRIATVLNEKSGYFGFRGDPAFNAVSAPLYSGSGTSLVSGAAIVVRLPGGTFTPAAGATASFMAFSGDTDGIRVTDGNGDTVTALGEGQILDITANISGIDSDTVPIMVVGLYTAEGKMLRLWGFTGSVGVGKTTASLTLPDDVQNCRLKVFYFNGTSNFTPVCNAYELSS